MKSTLFVLAAGTLALALTAFGQNNPTTTAQGQGRGRGGAPYAWGDKNKDGICDITGKPVGQNCGRNCGRNAGGMMGRGRGQGQMGGGCRRGGAAAVAPGPSK